MESHMKAVTGSACSNLPPKSISQQTEHHTRAPLLSLAPAGSSKLLQDVGSKTLTNPFLCPSRQLGLMGMLQPREPPGEALPHMAQHPQLWRCLIPELKAHLQLATIQTKCQVHFFVQAPCNSCVCLQEGLALFCPEVIQGINWHKQVREWKAQTA